LLPARQKRLPDASTIPSIIMQTLQSLSTLPGGFIQMDQQDAAAIRAELSAGLLDRHAHTSPKYLYDVLGSKLFEAICELPEYYPTRTEAAIFKTHLSDIAESVGRGATLIDLGAGNCAKAAHLFSALQPAQYVPIDISVDFLRDVVAQLRQRFPQVDMLGIGLDFSGKLNLPVAVRSDKRLFFYPGSSIGNFTPDEALAFLKRLHAACRLDQSSGGGVLIGVDLVKDISVLNAAYDDALGVTASFNLNLLLHLNNLLGADFNVRDWRHRGFFNPEKSRIEMHLEATRNLAVTWQGGQRRFEKGECIHTENSYKYTQESFCRLLQHAGFDIAGCWTDARDWFMVCHAKAI
jgi:dimethylhistidine N-methyltransferase